jgi:aspartate ammonia-lyase
VPAGEEVQRVAEVQKLLHEINLGATAIGTSVTAAPGYPELATRHLSTLTGRPFVLATDLVEATSDTGAYVLLSGALERTSSKLTKICNDIRLLASGPRCGLNEIDLPQMQPGSSIMPGKVNPVIPEVVNQVGFLVIGLDLTVTLAASAGQLQLNVMEPVTPSRSSSRSRRCRTPSRACARTASSASWPTRSTRARWCCARSAS